MERTFASLAVGLALACAAAAVAQAPAPQVPPIALPPRYEVEVIVFANRNFDPSEERFDQTPNGFDGDAAALREAPVFDDTNFGPLAPRPEPLPPLPVDPLSAQQAEQQADALRVRLLRPEELKLGNEYRRLQAGSGFRPLLHAGWVQPGLAEGDAEPFDLKVLGVSNPAGTIRVHLIRLLHITLDLTYQADGAASPDLAANDGLEEVALAPRYRLATTRGVRSNELHYFDHPAFGVLVRITPVPTQDAQGRRPAA
jgi:hypothetical protein